ncbi:MAG: hypothetical protein Q8L29_02390 [archaeon]|nr:hypothetical protein [archaeon]
MAEKELIIREKLEHSGIFNFSDIYAYAYRWLSDEEGFGVTEEKYSEKVAGGAREINIEWVAGKNISDYYRIELRLKLELIGLTDVDVEIEGKKKKMNKGKISIDMKGILIIDRESKWEATPFLRFMRDLYNKYIVPQRGHDFRMEVIRISKDFRDYIKSVLELTGKR